MDKKSSGFRIGHVWLGGTRIFLQSAVFQSPDGVPERSFQSILIVDVQK
jgi:hypothetical protein